MSNNDYITSVSKLDSKGKCKDKCSLTVHKKSPTTKKTVSLRWKKTDKAGEISINIVSYDEETAKAITYGDEVFMFQKPTKLSFYKNIDLVINGQTPDGVASLFFVEKGKKRDKILQVIIPFATGEKITPGTNLINKIIDNIISLQPNEDDEPTRLDNIRMLDLFPDKGSYYDSMSKDGKDHYIIIDTFQAIQTDDMEKIDKLFDVDQEDVKDIIREPGIKLNFSSYYKSETPIIEGLANMKKTASSSGDEIYIDCHPVGVDEDNKDVTEQYDKGKSKKTQTQLIFFLVLLLTLIAVMALLYGINYLIKKYAN